MVSILFLKTKFSEWDSVLSSSCLVASGKTARTNHVMLLHKQLYFEHMTIAGVQTGTLTDSLNDKILHCVPFNDSALVENRFTLEQYHSMRAWHIPLLMIGLHLPNCVSYVRARLGMEYKLETPDEFYETISRNTQEYG